MIDPLAWHRGTLLLFCVALSLALDNTAFFLRLRSLPGAFVSRSPSEACRPAILASAPSQTAGRGISATICIEQDK